MKVKELIKLLKSIDQDKDVILATAVNGLATVDDVDSVCENGTAIQLNGESLLEGEIVE